MTRRAALALLPLLAACRRDPVLIGVWDLVSLEIDGEAQDDYGTVEVNADGEMFFVLRYDWSAEGFTPRAQPEIGVVPTDGGAQGDFTQIWAEEGEVHDVSIDGDRYLFEDYRGASTALVGAQVVPFGEWDTVERDPETGQPAVVVDVVAELTR